MQNLDSHRFAVQDWCIFYSILVVCLATIVWAGATFSNPPKGYNRPATRLLVP